jgi:hypothetical protein
MPVLSYADHLKKHRGVLSHGKVDLLSLEAHNLDTWRQDQS